MLPMGLNPLKNGDGRKALLTNRFGNPYMS